MRRRVFVALLGGAAAAWPLAARSQQSTMPIIGFLSGRGPEEATSVLAAFRRGLNDVGLIDGRDVGIEYRWAERKLDRLPDLAADLVQSRVAVIAATGGDLSALSAKAATNTIPIVFLTGRDPVEMGLVARINRPNGNVTGVTLLTYDLENKRLGLLRELIPEATSIAVLLNPSYAAYENQLKDIEAAAAAVHQRIQVLKATNADEIDTAIASAAQVRANALLIGADPFFISRQQQIVVLTARHAIPTLSTFREFAIAGGLASYGSSFAEAYRQVGLYTGRILKGTPAGDLPVVQPTKFELVVNIRTAKALGLAVSPSLLARADEVIE